MWPATADAATLDRVVSGRALDGDAVAARAGIEVQLVVRGLQPGER